MSSVSASALVPSSVTVLPLTVTRPCSIRVSAVRREAIPAADRIFCSRSAIALVNVFYFVFFGGGRFAHPHGVRGLPCRRVRVERQRGGRDRGFRQPRGQLEAEGIGQLFDLRQIAEIAQAEPLEELARGGVHERSTNHLLAADGLDQPALDQR